MNTTLRTILAVIGGLLLGGILNMALIMLGPNIIPAPEGVDITTPEGLKAGIHLMEPKHFVFPFLAHALGTLLGAYLASLWAPSHKQRCAMIVGILFLLGGIANVMMLPSPLWFNVLDLGIAYLPMAYLGWKLGGGK